MTSKIRLVMQTMGILILSYFFALWLAPSVMSYANSQGSPVAFLRPILKKMAPASRTPAEPLNPSVSLQDRAPVAPILAPEDVAVNAVSVAEVVEPIPAQKKIHLAAATSTPAGSLKVLPPAEKPSAYYPEEQVIEIPAAKHLTRGFATDVTDIPRWKKEVVQEFQRHLPQPGEEMTTFQHHVVETLLSEGAIEEDGVGGYMPVDNVSEPLAKSATTESSDGGRLPSSRKPPTNRDSDRGNDFDSRSALDPYTHWYPQEFDKRGLNRSGLLFGTGLRLSSVDQSMLHQRLSGAPDYNFNSKDENAATNASRSTVHSLGHGGQGCFEIKEGALYDHRGIDFVLFENSFKISDKTVVDKDKEDETIDDATIEIDGRDRMLASGRYFVEPLKVRVATSCEDFRQGQYAEFPCEPTRARNYFRCAGVVPLDQGGDKFDLAWIEDDLHQLGISSVGCICVEDMMRSHAEGYGGVEGADLDALQLNYAFKVRDDIT